MVHLSVGVIAFLLLAFLSLLCVVALSACWAIAVPEAVDWEITSGGKMLRRAKYMFSGASSLIVVSLLLDVFVKNPTGPSMDFWIWDEHPHILILLLILSSGLSIAASFHAFQSKGQGRWVVWVGAPCIAALSLIAAICLDQAV